MFIEHFVSLPLREGRGSETYFTEQPTPRNTDGHDALRPSYNVVTLMARMINKSRLITEYWPGKLIGASPDPDSGSPPQCHLE